MNKIRKVQKTAEGTLITNTFRVSISHKGTFVSTLFTGELTLLYTMRKTRKYGGLLIKHAGPIVDKYYVDPEDLNAKMYALIGLESISHIAPTYNTCRRDGRDYEVIVNTILELNEAEYRQYKINKLTI